MIIVILYVKIVTQPHSLKSLDDCSFHQDLLYKIQTQLPCSHANHELC